MSHLHIVHDSDAHFTIDPITRAIKNESPKVTVIQHDHNSERFTFSIQKQVEGHDMSACNRVEIHYINIDATDKTKKATGVYEADDLKTSSDDSGKVTFSWLLSRNATQYAGSLNFLIRFACINDGVEEYAWNTAIFQSITVGSGMYNGGEEVIEPYLDVIAQWKNDLFGVGDTQEQRLLTVSAEQQAAIAAKGAAVLDSIPDEYEALQAQADENTRIKAGAIVLDAEGESIVLSDASEYPLQNLRVFGKSTQDGIPTPDAPVEIVSIENPMVNAYGKNLLKNTLETKTHLGCNIVVNNDGSVVINGTATSEGTIVFNNHLVLPLGTYELSGERAVAFLRDKDDKHKQTFFTGKTITIEDPTDYLLIGVYANKGQVFDNLKTYPMLRLAGETDDSFELHKEPQTVETSHTLHGIPVSSGGNYTDANGQQWICDEVDLARGVYVQRIASVTFSGQEDWYVSAAQIDSGTRFDCNISTAPYALITDCLCDRFLYRGVNAYVESAWILENSYGFRIITEKASTAEEMKAFFAANPTTLQYVMRNTIETPLTEAEISAFRALHSNKPNTTILNDAGAYMAVEYVADTKTYIDNKIAEALKGSEQA